MNALRRNAKVGTAYAGKFVSGINGLDGNTGNGWDWFYYINGTQASRGATDYTLHKGDREWWDYHYWAQYEDVPIVIGAWPEPFVNGYGGTTPTVAVRGLKCASELRKTLKAAGSHLTTGTTNYTVSIITFSQSGTMLQTGEALSRGLTVWLQNSVVHVYSGHTSSRAVPAAKALIVAYRPGSTVGGSAALVVAGATSSAACAAAHTLATNPASVRATYAVAMDGTGHVIARGGQP
jgi:hypothetical protein